MHVRRWISPWYGVVELVRYIGSRRNRRHRRRRLHSYAMTMSVRCRICVVANLRRVSVQFTSTTCASCRFLARLGRAWGRARIGSESSWWFRWIYIFAAAGTLFYRVAHDSKFKNYLILFNPTLLVIFENVYSKVSKTLKKYIVLSMYQC